MTYLANNQRSAPILSAKSIATRSLILLAASLISGLVNTTANADILGTVPEHTQNAITRLCQPLQFSQNSQAYRECILKRVSTAQSSIEAYPEQAKQLTLNEKHALQRACLSDGVADPDGYKACAAQQLQAIESTEKPAMFGLEQTERQAVSRQCLNEAASSGVIAYRTCANAAITELNALPVANYGDQSTQARNNMQLECSLSSANATGYRLCLLGALGISAESAAEQQLTANQNAEPEQQAVQLAVQPDNTEQPVQTAEIIEPTNTAEALPTTQPEQSTADQTKEALPEIAPTDAELPSLATSDPQPDSLNAAPNREFAAQTELNTANDTTSGFVARVTDKVRVFLDDLYPLIEMLPG